jgi:hypothetical protein
LKKTLTHLRSLTLDDAKSQKWVIFETKCQMEEPFSKNHWHVSYLSRPKNKNG